MFEKPAQFPESTRTLAGIANLTASISRKAIETQFPQITRFELYETQWNYFFTVAAVWIALDSVPTTQLISPEIIDSICVEGDKSIGKLNRIAGNPPSRSFIEGWNNLIGFMQAGELLRANLVGHHRKVQTSHTAALWIVWNLRGERPLNEDNGLLNGIGSILLTQFGSFFEN